MIYFTADTHFGHKNIIDHCDRPFESVEEMDAVMVERWNSVVTPHDTVYHLGDFVSFKKKEYEASKHNVFLLNGKIRFLMGNHDQLLVNDIDPLFRTIDIYNEGHYLELKLNGKYIALMHYPLATWNGRNHGSIHLHGHVHGLYDDDQPFNRLDVGVDSHDFYPVSLEKIIEEINV